jgi:hypothetical protein
MHGTLEGMEVNIKARMMVEMRGEMQYVCQEIKVEALSATHAECHQLVLPLKTEAVLMHNEFKVLKQNIQSRAGACGVSCCIEVTWYWSSRAFLGVTLNNSRQTSARI